MVALIAAGIVILLQVVAVIFLLAIRYHFRAFSIPGDARAMRLARLSTRGTIVLCLGAVAALAWFLVNDAPRFEALLQSVLFQP